MSLQTPFPLTRPLDAAGSPAPDDLSPEKGHKVRIKDLINTLNFINFQDKTILLAFRHKKYNNTLSVQVKPQPCAGKQLLCLWPVKSGMHKKLKSYNFNNFSFSDGQRVTTVEALEIARTEESISLELPDAGQQLTIRKAKRYPCEGINVQLVQHSIAFDGSLSDFNGFAFRVTVNASRQTFQWINPESSVYLLIRHKSDLLYSGECRIMRHTHGQETRDYVLEPAGVQIQRFKPKQFRSQRHILLPSPNVVLKHPLIRRQVNLEVEDISASGVAVTERTENCVLLPGMIIPEMRIEFASAFKVQCMAQVIYRVEKGDGKVECGLTYLDMNVQDHSLLAGVLHRLADSRSYISGSVDLDELWRFFFETGFVYPQKYAFIQSNKEKFKETYEKLYMRNPSIARHFIFQESGAIHAHMSMIRFYENTWLIHHHAADSAVSNRAGLVVLEQIGRYVNEFHSMYSGHMNYLICYFRPDNRFPNRVFGGAAKFIGDVKGCSIDPFAYFHKHITKTSSSTQLPEPWTLAETSPEDLFELESFYGYESGGLMLTALDLEPGMLDRDEIGKEFRRLDFRRERYIFSLKKEGDLKAVMTVNLSDIGLNMSDLTDCIQFIVLDSNDLPPDILHAVITRLSTHYQRADIPVLLYPLSFAQAQALPYDKVYNLWILSTGHLDSYFKFIESLTHRIKETGSSGHKDNSNSIS